MSETVSVEMRRMGYTLEPEASLSIQHQAEQDRETLWQCMQEHLDKRVEEDFA